MLDEALTGAVLAVHLIGENHGKTCEGADEPMVQLQLRRSAMGPTVPLGLRRLIWLPNGVKPANARQEAFLAGLRNFDLPHSHFGQDRTMLLPIPTTADQTLWGASSPPLVDRLLLASSRARWTSTRWPPMPTYRTCGASRQLLASGGAIVNVPLPLSQPQGRGGKSTRRASSLWSTLQSLSGAVRTSAGSRISSIGYGDQGHWAGPGRSGRLRLGLGPDRPEKREEDPTLHSELRIDLREGPDPTALGLLGPILGIIP